MKLKALIIDDEPLAHKVILEYAKNIPFLDIVSQCHLATEAMGILREKEIDLIFLDINMPKIKGLDFLRTLNHKPIVIITSAYEEYALESFELEVCDYLLKPFRFERFFKAANKASETFQLTQVKSHVPNSNENETNSSHLFIKSDKKLIQIDLNDIYFLESYGNYVKVWMKEEYHLTARTLSSFIGKIPETKFFRIHKSYIINKLHIDYIEGNSVMMKNAKLLAIGKNQRQDFKRFIEY